MPSEPGDLLAPGLEQEGMAGLEMTRPSAVSHAPTAVAAVADITTRSTRIGTAPLVAVVALESIRTGIIELLAQGSKGRARAAVSAEICTTDIGRAAVAAVRADLAAMLMGRRG